MKIKVKFTTTMTYEQEVDVPDTSFDEFMNYSDADLLKYVDFSDDPIGIDTAVDAVSLVEEYLV